MGTNHHDSSLRLTDKDLNMNLKERKKLLLVLLITFLFMMVEVVGGLISNSLALLSDAAHMLGDSTALGVSFFSLVLATVPPSRSNTFGLQKVESLAGLVNSLLLLFMAATILYNAFLRYSSPPEIDAVILIAVASLGLLVNILAAFILGKDATGLALRSAFLNVLGDAISSIGAVVAGLLIYFYNWYMADVLISLVVAGIIIYSSMGLLKASISIILQAVPDEINLDSLEEDLNSIEEVQTVHDLHIWSLRQGKVIMTVHLVSETSDRDELILKVKRILKSKYPISQSTIQVEAPGWDEKI